MYNTGYFIVLANLIVWLITFVIYQRHSRAFDAGSAILALYLLYSVSSFFLYISPESRSDYTKITFFPFIYFFIVFYFAFLPVRNCNYKKIIRIARPSDFLINSISVFIILLSLISIVDTIEHIGEGLTLILLDTGGGKELYETTADTISKTGSGSLANIVGVISSSFHYIGVFLFFYYLTFNKEKRKTLIIWGLGISMVLGILSGIASGSRNGAVNNILGIGITYFLFKGFYSEKIRRTVRIVGLVFVILITIPIVAITTSRFGEEQSSSSVLLYVGSGNLNFNQYALDDNGIRYGDRTIPLFKRMLGFNNVPRNYIERRAKYPQLKINDESFSTFIGDFAIDYGPFLCVLIFIIGGVLFYNKTRVKAGVITFGQLLGLHFVLCMLVQGGTLFSFADVGGNLRLIVYLIIYVLAVLSLPKGKSFSKLSSQNI